MKTFRIVLVFIPILWLYSCMPNYSYIEGYAQGTTYHIVYKDSKNHDYHIQLDSLLKAIDMSLSTYVPTSIISRVNQNDSTVITDAFFEDVFNRSQEIAAQTNGAFDITVAPLVNAWGFGIEGEARITDSLVKNILENVGYQKVKMANHKVIKSTPYVMLDGNAIAQGYTVDVLADFLEEQGVTDYMVEVGGEVRTKGKNSKNEVWKIGVDKPIEGSNEYDRELQAVMGISNLSMATSGSYRKYYEKEGMKYSHTINPLTGYPVKHTLLSATILSSDCMSADAYATACMVMGLEKSMNFVQQRDDLDAYFIYADSTGAYQVAYTEGIEKLLIEQIEKE